MIGNPTLDQSKLSLENKKSGPKAAEGVHSSNHVMSFLPNEVDIGQGILNLHKPR